MADLLDFALPVAFGANVAQLTGKSGDGFTAAGYGAFVQSVTGNVPVASPLPGKRAKISLKPEQVKAMQAWLDSQVSVLLSKPKEQSLDIDMNAVFVPWSLKYVVPVAIVCFLTGWLLHYYMVR